MTGRKVDKLAGDRGYRGVKQIGKRVCQNSFSAKDSYHFVKNNRYQRVNNSMITVTLIFMRE